MKKSKGTVFKFCFTAMLIALNVVLERLLAFTVGNQQIGFSFIPVAFAAVYLGPMYALAVSALGDILGAVLLSTQGAFFPGFTVTAALTGLCTGLLLNKKATVPRILANVLLNFVFGSVLLNTFWLSAFFIKSPFLSVLISRIPQFIIMPIVHTLVDMIVFWNKSPVRKTLDREMNKIFARID